MRRLRSMSAMRTASTSTSTSMSMQKLECPLCLYGVIVGFNGCRSLSPAETRRRLERLFLLTILLRFPTS